MKIALVAAGVCLLAASSLRKDRGAMMIYEGRDRVISVVPHADSANIALIVLWQAQGDSVPKARLAGRSCVGLALFSKWEWAALLGSGRKPSEIRPQEASMRARLYPATSSDPPVVEDIQTGRAWQAVNLIDAETATDARSRSFYDKWPVPGYVRRATGPCTVE